MFYLKFVEHEGDKQHSISCYSYDLEYDATITAYKVRVYCRSSNRFVYEKTYNVGPSSKYCSLFVMNINGDTIGKITPPEQS